MALTDPDTVPISMTTALRLQAVMNACEDKGMLCSSRAGMGGDGRPLRGVPHRTRPDARPDLGRPRSERWPMAMLRLWLADGHALGPTESDA